MMYNFYLDGKLVENPVGWDNMISSIKRDKDLKGVFLTMDVTFTFNSTGFRYLKQQFDTHGYCSQILLKIEQSADQGDNFINFYDGIINISDIEFMMRQDNLEEEIIVDQYAKVKVLDNSFFSKIYNNRKLKTNICAGKTKNGLDITPCTIHSLRMFDPADGTDVPTDQEEAITWLDAFRYLIEFMTDADVTFDSNLFSTGRYSQCILTYGLPIFYQGGGITMTQADFIAKLPLLSFEDFFKEIDVKANLGLYIDNSGAKPKVRIELWDDLFLNDTSVQIRNINSIKTRISVEDIFSKLILGNTETLESLGALHFPETIDYIGFKPEEYAVLGKCNIATEKDLTGKFVVASNVIEEILINNPAGTTTPNETYNKKFFLIDAVNIGGLYRAIKSNWIDPSSAQRYYNERFTNSNVANNFLKAVPNDIAAYLGGVLDVAFLATPTINRASAGINTSNPFSVFPVRFDNDTVSPASDPNNVYSPVTNEFTVPALGFGQYSFYSRIDFDLTVRVTLVNDANVTLHMLTRGIFHRYDSLSVFVASYNFSTVNQNQSIFVPAGTFDLEFHCSLSGSATINLNAGDTIRVEYNNDAPTFSGPIVSISQYRIIIRKESQFACTGNTTGGGNYQTYKPDEYPIILDSFEQELSKTAFDKIAAKPLSLIEFSQGSQEYKKGWINELRYDHEKGIGVFKLLSAKNTN